jgi:hypothetical protein
MSANPLLTLLARAIANQAVRQRDAQNSSDPGVITTRATSTPMETPCQEIPNGAS